jgi:hypothetical protein
MHFLVECHALNCVHALVSMTACKLLTSLLVDLKMVQTVESFVYCIDIEALALLFPGILLFDLVHLISIPTPT